MEAVKNHLQLPLFVFHYLSLFWPCTLISLTAFQNLLHFFHRTFPLQDISVQYPFIIGKALDLAAQHPFFHPVTSQAASGIACALTAVPLSLYFSLVYELGNVYASFLRFAINLQIGFPIEENFSSYSVIILPFAYGVL